MEPALSVRSARAAVVKEKVLTLELVLASATTFSATCSTDQSSILLNTASAETALLESATVETVSSSLESNVT